MAAVSRQLWWRHTVGVSLWLLAVAAVACADSAARSLQPDTTQPGPDPVPEDTTPLDTVVLALGSKPMVTVGSQHACIFTPAGRLTCWGDWGAGPTPPQDVPLPLKGDGSSVPLAAVSPSGRLCALAQDGRPFCAKPSQDPRAVLQPVPTRHRFTQVVGGLGSLAPTCALTPRRDAYCWGNGLTGALGTGRFGDGYNEPVPVPVVTPLRFTTLSSSGGYVWCGVSEQAGIHCWGSWPSGFDSPPILPGSCADSFWIAFAERPCATPTKVPNSQGFVHVTSNAYASCGIERDGRASCWGFSAVGELGNGKVGPSAYAFWPDTVHTSARFTWLSAGGGFICGLAIGGQAYCWGTNFRGSLGIGGPNVGGSAKPVPVSGGHNFTSISAGPAVTCAVDDQNGVWCWGIAWRWQLGRPDELGDAYAPIRVTLPPQ